jgi:hypothetical protein
MKTVRNFAAAIMVFGAASMAQAQSDVSSGLSGASFGAKAGISFANFTGDDFEDADSRTSFHVGLVAEVPVADRFSIQGEVLYSSQGIKGDLPFTNREVEYQLDYISVPVLAKVYITNGLSVEVGPQFSFLVNEEIDFDADDDDGDFETSEAESFDFALAGGLTFQTDMGLFLTGRYTYGLTDIFQRSDARNSVFQVGVGFKF